MDVIKPDLLDTEIGEYLRQPSSALKFKYANPLEYWRENESKFKHVAVLARRLLSVVSSSPSERVASVLSRELTKQRMNLSPSNVPSLIYMPTFKKFENILEK